MKLRFLVILLTLSTYTDQQIISQAGEDSFTIFCTGNQDSTGVCFEGSNPDEQKKLDCIMVPGNIIDCKNQANEKVECILIAATSAQAEFSCNKNNEVSIDYGSTPVEDNSPNQPNNMDQDNTIHNTNKSTNDAIFFTDAF